MMIAGMDSHICDKCVSQAGGILHAELGEQPQSNPLEIAGKLCIYTNHSTTVEKLKQGGDK